MRAALPSACLLALLLAAPARAEDPADALARFAERAARLPAPSAANGFVLEGDLVLNGRPVGTFRLAAAPAEGPTWKLDEQMTFGSGEGAMRRQSVSIVSPALAPLRGKLVRDDEDGHAEVAWQAGATGVTVERSTPSGTPTTTEVAGVSPATTGIASLVVLGRVLKDDEGPFAVHVLDPEDAAKGKPAFEVATAVWQGTGTWHGDEALLLASTKGEKTITVAFHPQTRAVLGLRMEGAGMPTLELLPAGAVAPTDHVDFDAPAKDARTAALRAALGFATADMGLIEDVIHWPTIYEAMKAHLEEGTTVDDVRSAILANLAPALQKRPRGTLAPVLESVASTLELTERPDGRTVVTFPPTFQSLKLVVGEVDGTWYLVELPAPPGGR